MALWLVRSGRFGEHEQKFVAEKRIYLTWRGLGDNLSKLKDRDALIQLLEARFPKFSAAKMRNHAAQLWAFTKRMKEGDWVVVPSKVKPAINIGEITGPYHWDKNAIDPYYHSREVKWIAKDVPRSVFDQDLLYSFGAIMTICEVKRNDAEKRVRALATSDWKDQTGPAANRVHDAADEEGDAEAPADAAADLEQPARDQIAKHIIRTFKGHGLERLVKAILDAQGYTTYHSPTGPDKGIDLLAAPGPLGFGSPRICVQVKSSDGPTDT
jgi:restriction system protein